MASEVIVQDVCGVGKERARELLEAASGNIERAIEIHFDATARERRCATAMDTARNIAMGTDTHTRSSMNVTSPIDMGEELLSRISPKSPSPHKKQTKVSSFFIGGSSLATEIASVPVVPTRPICITNCELVKGGKRKKFPTTSEGSFHKAPNNSAVKQMKNTTGKVHYSSSDPPCLQYLTFAKAFSEMAQTTKRLIKIDALKSSIRGVVEAVGGINCDDELTRVKDGEILCRTLQLMLPNTIKLQVSGSAVSKAIIAVTGASRCRLREAYRKTGDLGDAAEQFVRNQTLLVQPKPLTISGVHAMLQKISSQEGKGSQTQRHALMVQLLRSCRQSEMRFLVRTLLGNMRIGATLKTVLVALASVVEELDAAKNQREACISDAAKAIQKTYDICPRLDRISCALLLGGIAHMQKICVLEVGTPVNPMLANAAHSFDEVQQLMVNHVHDDNVVTLQAVAEWKYDGVRCQAHFDGESIKLYSRNMLDNTDQYPDAVKSLLEARLGNAKSFIIDAEIVAIEEIDGDDKNFRLLPFQDLATRSGAVPGSNENPVCIRIYAFDLIFVNGTSQTSEPLWKRQQMLRKHFQETPGFCFASSLTLSSYNENIISDFLEKAVKGGAEGLMVKLTGKTGLVSAATSQDLKRDETPSKCHYEPGTRSQTWLKVKRDYVARFADTIDVVPIGAWHGTGRKAQKGFLSPILLAVYDEDEDVFRSVSRCMSFSDKMYCAMREYYFYGTPYPIGVGMESTQINKTESSKKLEQETINSDAESDENTNEGVVVASDEEDHVNCYSDRPSCALIVTNESPPIWFKPKEVFEVSFADLSLSRVHTAAAGVVDADSSRGVALRFPRFRRRRPDKSVEQATTTVQLATMFAKQAKQGRRVHTSSG